MCISRIPMPACRAASLSASRTISSAPACSTMGKILSSSESLWASGLVVLPSGIMDCTQKRMAVRAVFKRSGQDSMLCVEKYSSGSLPPGRERKRMSRPSRRPMGRRRRAAFCPAASESKKTTNCLVKRRNWARCSSVTAVPWAAMTP